MFASLNFNHAAEYNLDIKNKLRYKITENTEKLKKFIWNKAYKKTIVFILTEL